ncbi:hypothetical protein ABPG77_007297 [Micractinium sp. CCAP 211/92]
MASVAPCWAASCSGAFTTRRGRRPHHSRPVTTASGGPATTAATDGTTAARTADLSTLTLEELQRTLAQRRLEAEGSRAELEARLAAFLAAPAQHPQADCSPACDVRVVGGRLFGGIPPLRRHIQLLFELLQGDEVAPGHPDYEFLLGLLRMHPRYAEKVAHPPVQRFRVRVILEDDQPPIRFFEFQDGRGIWDDFSTRKCLGFDSEHNAALTFRDAMRLEVQEQLEAFRLASTGTSARGAPIYRCDECRRRVRNGKSLRLEHVEPSFGQLIKDFSAAMNRPPPPVDGKVPGTNRGCFTDAEWAAAWRRYHRRHAKKLQLVCFQCVKQRNAGQAAGAGSGSDSAA